MAVALPASGKVESFFFISAAVWCESGVMALKSKSNGEEAERTMRLVTVAAPSGGRRKPVTEDERPVTSSGPAINGLKSGGLAARYIS